MTLKLGPASLSLSLSLSLTLSKNQEEIYEMHLKHSSYSKPVFQRFQLYDGASVQITKQMRDSFQNIIQCIMRNLAQSLKWMTNWKVFT